MVSIALAAGAAVFCYVWPPPQVPRLNEERQALRDSIQAARIADSIHLRTWADSVLRLRGDSLRSAYSATATRWRTRYLPGRIDTLLQRDTLRDSVVVAGADLRAGLVVDSAQQVRIDSLEGSNAELTYDLEECQAALASRPASSGYWRGFRDGSAVGALAGLTVCAILP
jgi:hypothetical protein